jgi:hypothetical protein
MSANQRLRRFLQAQALGKPRSAGDFFGVFSWRRIVESGEFTQLPVNLHDLEGGNICNVMYCNAM